MGWEKRGNGLYYYRKIRKGQRVASEYLGASKFTELVYTIDASDREQRKTEQQEWKEKKSEVQTVDLEIEQLNKMLRSLILATLLISGYHPHKGQWRRLRHAQ